MEFIPRFPCNCLHVFFSNIGAFHIFRWDFQSKNTTGPPWYFTAPVTDGLRCRWMLAAAGGGNFSSQDMVNEGMMTPPNPTSKDELGKHIWQKFCFWEISSFIFFFGMVRLGFWGKVFFGMVSRSSFSLEASKVYLQILKIAPLKVLLNSLVLYQSQSVQPTDCGRNSVVELRQRTAEVRCCGCSSPKRNFSNSEWMTDMTCNADQCQ